MTALLKLDKANSYAVGLVGCRSVAFSGQLLSEFDLTVDLCDGQWFSRRLFGSSPIYKAAYKPEEEAKLERSSHWITLEEKRRIKSEQSIRIHFNHFHTCGESSRWHRSTYSYMMNRDSRTSHIVPTDTERQRCDMWINHVGRGMCWYSTDSSDFAYPWKAFSALWSNIWRADKNPSVASKQLRGLTLSKRGFYFPTVSTSCVYFIEPFSSHSGARRP